MNNKCQIVWVYGTSGAGKETFIKYIMDNPSPELLDRLGWQDKKINYIRESVDYIGQFFGDPIVEKRKSIVSQVKQAVEDNDVVLIKVQDVDFGMNIISNVKKVYPKNLHKIIFLTTTLDELYKRCQKKSWYKPEFDRALFGKWALDQLERLETLKDFELVVLDSSDTDYKSVQFSPEKYKDILKILK